MHNESGVSKAFNLNAYGSVKGAPNSYGSPAELPTGLNVVFKNSNGQVITATNAIPVDGSQKIQVELTVAENVAAKSYTFAVLAGAGNLNDAIAYQANVTESANFSAITLTPNGATQVEAGAVTFYDHRLENKSTGEQTITVKASRETGTNWSHVVAVTGATSGVVKEAFTNVTADGFTVALPAGAFVDLQVKVLVPADALGGYTDTLTLKASIKSEAETVVVKATATDLTTVIQGQVQLIKSVATVTDGKYGEFKTRLDNVKPGEKVVWKIRAVVQGSSEASNIIITDAVPEYTTLVDGSAKIGGSESGAGKGYVKINGNNISFNVGTGATDKTGGSLDPGQSVEVTFEVQLDK